jgi:simple sugar transport system ATP-binding protein
VPAASLSGGNQQKVIVAREFTRGGRLLVAAQPTRGVDVGSTEFIHRKLVEARDKGMAVLLVSAELDEVLSLADRIAVMYRGRVAGVLDGANATPEVLGYMMATGQRPEEAAAAGAV